jgi:lipoyl-dependent peroxiredoxin
VGATFQSTTGDQAGRTTPEELLAVSHAVCFGVGLRSLIGRRGGRARVMMVTATITADKGPQGILIKSSHLSASIEGLEGMDAAQLEQAASETKERCTISVAIGGTVAITHHVGAV